MSQDTSSPPLTAADLSVAWYDLADAFLKEKRLDEAVDAYRQALDLNPDFPEAHTNLANLLAGQGQPAAAEAHYRQALALGLDHPLVHYNLANLLKTVGRLDEAIDSYRRALELGPAYADAFNNLGNALRGLNRLDEAADVYLKALEIRPDYDEAHSNLANVLYLLHRGGSPDVARRHAELWLARHPDNPTACHIGLAMTGQALPERAPDDYIRRTFDYFAQEFEARLTSLNYQGPAQIAAALAAELGPPAPTRSVLDAGCGTGLCAPGLRPFARRLVGMDLSPGMLAQAAERGLYDHLEEAEFTAFLEATAPGSYDLVVAADVFCYFGDLRPVLARLAPVLTPGGYFAFTIETQAPTAEADDYAIGPHGRYRHREDYLRRELAAAGLEIRSLRADVLRQEGGGPVMGLVGVARRP